MAGNSSAPGRCIPRHRRHSVPLFSPIGASEFRASFPCAGFPSAILELASLGWRRSWCAIATLRHSFAARMTSFVWGTTAGGRGHVTRVDKAFACASTSCPPLVRSSACDAWRNNRRNSLYGETYFCPFRIFLAAFFTRYVINFSKLYVQFVLLSLDTRSAGTRAKLARPLSMPPLIA